MMYRLQDWYHDVLAQADPRVQVLPLSGSPVPMLSIVALYVVLVTLGPKWMEHKKPVKLTNLLIVYNFLMVFLSGVVFLDTVMIIVKEKYSPFCQEVDYSDSRSGWHGIRIGWCFFFLKLIELLDTIFFVLRKKNSQITFLHVYHHATMVIATWLGMKFVPGGNSFLHPMINSLVHVVMYTYYGMSAIGPHMQKYLWWKRYLTMFQLTQFVIMVSHSFINIISDCNFPKIFNKVVIVYASSIMLLFINFYQKAYIQRRPTKHTQIKKHHVTNGNHYINGITPVFGKKED
ncbi:elongation of very long chain fatty acids protein 4-like isoform X2 [Gigantopelta aegis]|nr:elongation of very long chain fatty acids protein 4-like isoform X2 [Gigantopelta aegis]XP_041357224.1 elongation of very long chain fatty acids protein 4-like isoform X2 [Gigantopelta aegis]XP_041357225.1 elongation of very long chain fatty acids protein 4-like isoform X2 [Gigantopelta aegis]